jgi:hypothetical protein
MFIDCPPREAIARYVSADYIQHNPHVATGKAGSIDYLERMTRQSPGKRVEVKQAVAAGVSAMGSSILGCQNIEFMVVPGPVGQKPCGYSTSEADQFCIAEHGLHALDEP